MARHEADREDLLREATALVERCELRTPSFPEPIVAGFRRNGLLSVYFGADPVVQFNGEGRLRRGFWRHELLKAEGGKLVRMRRERTDTESLLVSVPMSTNEQDEMLRRMETLLDALVDDLASERFEIVGQVPPGDDVVGKLLASLRNLPRPLAVADRPHAG